MKLTFGSVLTITSDMHPFMLVVNLLLWNRRFFGHLKPPPFVSLTHVLTCRSKFETRFGASKTLVINIGDVAPRW